VASEEANPSPSATGLDKKFADVYLDVLRRMETVYDDHLPCIAAWQQAPMRIDRDLAYLHLQVFSIQRGPGKLTYLAGSESATDAFLNDVSPERAAQLLRKART
jgi:UDPglucose--hexose-1-phosphate uridylyltransferase